jgi:diacylglycerol kinase
MQKRAHAIEHKKFFSSVCHAYRGMRIAFGEEQNIRIHALCACFVLLFALLFRVRIVEWMLLLFSITLVLVMELVNSIFERFSDMVKPQVSHLIATVKDMSAAAVLICAINASIIGVIIFFPKLFLLFRV